MIKRRIVRNVYYSMLLLFIYSMSFLVISISAVPQTFLSSAEVVFSSIKFSNATFMMAIVPTIVIFGGILLLKKYK